MWAFFFYARVQITYGITGLSSADYVFIVPWPACATAHRDRRRPWHGFWGSGYC